MTQDVRADDDHTTSLAVAVVLRVAAAISLLGVSVSGILALFVPLASAGCEPDTSCSTVILVAWIALVGLSLAGFVAEIRAIVVARRRPKRAAALIGGTAVVLVAAWVVAQVAVNSATGAG